jgi:outer membrane receptor for ferrienterochelin and colicin
MARFPLFIGLLLFPGLLLAGTTGKIAGHVKDARTGEPLPAVNVIVEGTTLGAATDLDGDFTILNVPPGVYTVMARMMGYQQVRMVKVLVTVDHTTRVDFSLQPTVVEVSEAVTVVAERPIVQMDLTSSSSTISAEEMSRIPVESFRQVLELQAGVVQGAGGGLHIRGGRSSEIAYMIDGISITDPYGNSLAVNIENNAIQELQLVSGTFNAEYGQAMSGIVNIVTKDGDFNRYSGNVVYYGGDYLSADDSLFFHIDDVTPFALKDLQTSLTGPVPGAGKKLSFYASARVFDDEGYLYGLRRFNPQDSSNFDDPDPANWYVEETGDSAIVPMNPFQRISGQWKFTYRPFSAVKITYGGLYSRTNFRTYSHKFRYNPDGDYRKKRYGYTNILTLTHTLSPTTFYELKFSSFFNDFRQFVYENPEDPRYVSPLRFNATSGFRFHTGGTRNGHLYRNTLTNVGKLDFVSQVTKVHQLKAGAEFRWNRLYLEQFTVLVDQSTNWRPVVPYPTRERYRTTPAYNRYVHHPTELAVYLQDKIELVDMIVNVGLRYERFDPDGVVPADPEDPNILAPVKVENQAVPLEERQKYWWKRASVKHQLSPRLGIAYPITDKGVIHFSYGHFLQIPPYAFLYTNPDFEVTLGLSTLMGNADLEPQRTISYEIGLQQQIGEDIGLNITAFYKDIRNLLGTEIRDTFLANYRYALYINRDFGNVRGITISIKKRPKGLVAASIDYTYGVAEGNASDPTETYFNALNKEEPAKFLVPLDWDQTHTLNASVTLARPQSWTLSAIARFGSGLPYTPSITGFRAVAENSERKPPQFSIDVRASKSFRWLGAQYSVYVNIYNLTDRRNEEFVYGDTGRATYTLIPTYTPEPHGINTLAEYLTRPDFFSSPRQVKFGVEVSF